MIVYPKARKIFVLHQPGNNGQASPQLYEQAVVRVLDQISARPTGALLLRAINACHVGMVIVPYDPAIFNGDQCNAWAGTDNLEN